MSHNSKFFSLMRTLSADELSGFQKFLNRYHHGEAATLKVFTYCKRFHDPNTNADKIDLASVYRKLFKAEMGDQENARKKLLNPLSDLGIWLKEFLLAEKMRSESWVSKMVWLGILQERGLHGEFSKLVSSVYKEQGKILPDAAACIQRIATGLYYKRHLVQHKASPDFQALIECAESIKQGADILSLKTTCEILNDQKIRPQESVEAQGPSAQPLMLLYQRIFSLLSTDKEEDYAQIVSFLDEHLELLGETEVLTVTRLLHNFAGPKVRSSKIVVWRKQVHALDKILLKKGLYTQKGVISPTSFCNIVNVASSAQEINWAKNFMLENEHSLPEDAREESLKLANAIIAFEEKNFKKALELVENPQLRQVQHIARSKALKLRALYELNPEDDAIEDLYISFEIYLKRNRQEHPDFVDATLSFVSLFKKLYQKKLSKQQLLQAIEASPHLYFYHWLLEQAERYKSRNAR